MRFVISVPVFNVFSPLKSKHHPSSGIRNSRAPIATCRRCAVDISKCRHFVRSTFWNVEVLVYRRFGCQRFDLSSPRGPTPVFVWFDKSENSHYFVMIEHNITMTSRERNVFSNHWSFRCLFNSLCGPTSKKHKSIYYWHFSRRIHGWTVNSPHKETVTRKSFHVMAS